MRSGHSGSALFGIVRRVGDSELARCWSEGAFRRLLERLPRAGLRTELGSTPGDDRSGRRESAARAFRLLRNSRAPVLHRTDRT
jgi:hypothetical protein